MIPEQKKAQYWNHFVTRWVVDKVGGAHGMTGPKLRKVKPIIWDDNFFWSDVIARHGGMGMTPEEMQARRPGVYDHCLGNFWGMIVQDMVERGWLK
jgi:hypothetical protein